jgi:hypothetical protein
MNTAGYFHSTRLDCLSHNIAAILLQNSNFSYNIRSFNTDDLASLSKS